MIIIINENDTTYVAQPLFDLGGYRMSNKTILHKDNCPQWYDRASDCVVATDGLGFTSSALRYFPEIIPNELNIQNLLETKDKLKAILRDLKYTDDNSITSNKEILFARNGEAYLCESCRIFRVEKAYALGYCNEIALGSFLANTNESPINKIKIAVKDCCEAIGQGYSNILLTDTKTKKTRIVKGN